jgi:murein DD-endopeptidase MepM/ murein hydrolase activator NlpD
MNRNQLRQLGIEVLSSKLLNNQQVPDRLQNLQSGQFTDQRCQITPGSQPTRTIRLKTIHPKVMQPAAISRQAYNLLEGIKPCALAASIEAASAATAGAVIEALDASSRIGILLRRKATQNLFLIAATFSLAGFTSLQSKIVAAPLLDLPSDPSPFAPSQLAISQLTTSKQAESVCPEPALSRLIRHRVAANESLESIAQQYNLLPTTLMGLNPSLRQGSAQVGSEILIPPYNGIRVTVPAGSSWRDIAKQYNVRPDVVFELNGCQAAPEVVFIPGVNWSPAPSPSVSQADRSPINHYPLPDVASILLAYGWQVNPVSNAVEFHSGVNLAATEGTPVLAAGSGTVAFAGQQSGSGNLVVINHSEGLQTRYARLDTITVKVGEQVQSGDPIGTVAASSSEPYLHFQVRSNSRLGWVAQDPGVYFQDLAVGVRR